MDSSLMCHILRYSHHLDGWMRLDVSPFYDISYITFGRWAAEDIGAGQPRGQAIKSQCFGRGWHAQSSTAEGERSEVQGGKFLRSARHRTGEVRDAASRVRRQNVGDPGVRRIWRDPTNLLSGPG